LTLAAKPAETDWQYTICSLPHAFKDVVAIRQENAIRSWQTLWPPPEVILIGDDPGVAEAATRLGCKHEPSIRRNEFGTPLVNSMFEVAQASATHDLVCYTNCDVMLVGLANAMRVCAEAFDQFLMVGRRWDVDIHHAWDFVPDWETRLWNATQHSGKLHSLGALDYFAFRRGLYVDVPDFAVGRSAWDNWLVSHVVQRDIPVIDASAVVLTVHQDMPRPSPMTAERAEERKRNRVFYDRDCRHVRGSAKNANWILTKGGLAKR